jgi:pilus assembly protein CpaF
MSLQEITGMEGNIITLQEIFSFEQTAVDAEGHVRGRFKFHGIRPRFMDRFKVAGVQIHQKLFDPSQFVEI